MRNSESLSPTPASEYVGLTGETGIISVTLPAQQSVVNCGYTGGYLTFKRPGNANPERDYFAGGQEKHYVINKLYGSDGFGNLDGSDINVILTGGITGIGDLNGTTTTTTTAGA